MWNSKELLDPKDLLEVIKQLKMKDSTMKKHSIAQQESIRTWNRAMDRVCEEIQLLTINNIKKNTSIINSNT